MKNYFILGIALLCFTACKDRKNEGSASGDALYKPRPKLVVGIVVDQMRYDYLPRFWHSYGEGGFKRMVAEGFNCKNNHFNYIPTYTAPGHASVYTGTTPAYHGIIANNWYEKETDKMVYCTDDETVMPVGTTDNLGKMSPRRMQTTSVADQLRLATQMQAKVIGISIKDRGAILAAGHTANAAYWFRSGEEGHFITSSYYMNTLPDWVNAFNTSGKADEYIKVWNTLYDIDTYKESGPDNNPYEGKFNGESAPVFPHDLPKLKAENDNYGILNYTPFGNSLTTDFALAAIDGEKLGEDDITDFLAISYSATDYVGHRFGAHSKEVQDTYLRLDKDLERLFKALDEKVGKGNYTVFLTADHGAVHAPSYLQSLKIPAGYFDGLAFRTKLDSFLTARFKTDKLIKNISNNQLFLDVETLKRLRLETETVEKAIAGEIRNYKDIAAVYTGTGMKTQNYTQGLGYVLQKGYHPKRSGNVLLVLDPAVVSYPETGSTHGSGFTYDTHVPLLFFGKGIRHGETTGRTEISDIAPTVSALLGIAFPNGATGNPIGEVME